MELAERRKDGSDPAAEGDELEALALAARDGTPASFDRLARRIAGRLLAYATRTLGDRGLAEEAVQEALVRAYRFMPRYTGGSVLAWTLRITQRCCVDVVRRERRATRLRVVEPAPEPDRMETADLRAAVEQALARLAPHLRQTFLLHQQGLSYADVAGVLGIPVGTVRSRMYDARRLLRAMLTEALAEGGAA